MEDTLTQLGVGALVAILIIREVFSFLKTKNGNSPKIEVTAECIRTIDRVEEQIGKVKHSLNNNLTVINGSYHQMKELRTEIKELKLMVEKLSNMNTSD
jgi:archaellum component FlaC